MEAQYAYFNKIAKSRECREFVCSLKSGCVSKMKEILPDTTPALVMDKPSLTWENALVGNC
jgi:hypothetical protein